MSENPEILDNETYSERIIYTSWNLDICNLPSRGKLIGLQPIAAGTTNGESLLSYFARLAYEYRVSPNKMLSYVISKSSVSPDQTEKMQLSWRTNGMNSQTAVLIKMLEELTQRNDIYFTNLIAFKGRLYTHKVVKRKRVWCPYCFAEQINNLGLNYEKLIWMVNSVVNCSLHNIWLEDECHNCGEKPKAYSEHLRPGYCSKCFVWLGNKNHLRSDKQTRNLVQELKKKRILKN